MIKISNESLQTNSQKFLSPLKSRRSSTKSLTKQNSLVNSIQYLIFEHTNNLHNYTRNDIQISQGQFSTTYFISGTKNKDITFYMGHGFGGSSLMYFPIFNQFLQKGNIVLWEVRGMGVGIKNSYPDIQDSKINGFYVEGLKKIVDFYNHKKIVFVCHSLSGYVSLRYLMQYSLGSKVLKVILLSPIGITAKQRDYKNRVTSCNSCIDALINAIGWKFKLTFKSPMRTVLCCLKNKILKKAFSQFSLSEDELQIMLKLFNTLVDLPDGSQNIFFRYFHPRVLPRSGQSIQELIRKTDIDQKVSVYYGGDQDWVDKKGIEDLSRIHKNFKYQIFRNSGHMVCLYKDLMNHVLDQQIK